jgi:hypothetical protein
MADSSQWTQQDFDNYAKRYAPAGPAAASPTALPTSMNNTTPGTPAPITDAQGVTGTQAPVGQISAQGAPTTVAQSFQQGLVNRLNPQAITADNPSIAPAIQANRQASQRGLAMDQNALAEQAARDGTASSGGNTADMLGLVNDSHAREGAYAGNLIQQQNDLQNQNQTSALGMAGSLLSGQQNLGQQASLANLDAEIRREALQQQGSLGQGDLSLRSQLGNGQLNLGLLSALMQNSQFGQSLGQNASQFGASLDQSGLLGLLGLL